MNPTSGILVFTCIVTLAFGSGPLKETKRGPEGGLRQVNLVRSKNANGQWIDPRGLLTVKGSMQEIAQLRQTVGDVVCPGTQGTAFLIGEGRDILTNAHIFVDENGKDRANLDKCFWQNKEEPFERMPIETSEHQMRFFTRSPAKEFYLDLAIARLRQPIPRVHPLPFSTKAPVEIGERIFMISAGQLRMPSLPNQVTEFIRGDPDRAAFEFNYNREAILQGCTVMAVGRPADAVANDSIYSDCSATRGASGSPILVRSQVENWRSRAFMSVAGMPPTTPISPWKMQVLLAEVIRTPFNLNQNILGEIGRFEADQNSIRTR